MKLILTTLLLFAAQSIALAQSTGSTAPPTPARPASAASSASAGPMDFLSRTQTIIRKAGEAFDNPDRVSEEDRIDAATRIARDVPLSPREKGSQAAPRAAQRLPQLGDLVPAVPGMSKADLDSHTKGGILIFVSDSMPEAQLKAAMEVGIENGVPVLFRGVREGESLNKGMLRPYRIASRMDPVPEVHIDPRPFSEFGIQSVPSLVVWEGEQFVKVSGTLSVSYAKKRFEEGRFGDAGVLGQTFEIVEPDFLEEMARRINKIDWDDKKKQAIARFWTNYQFHRLPAVENSEVRYFDPTVFVDDEIRDPEGRLIAPAGVTFNPLDLVAFNRTIVAFDATDRRQLEFARGVAQKELASGRVAVLITTSIDTSRPWDSLSDYNRFLFPNQIFLLDQLLAVRFGIDAIPSVIKAEGRLFRIEKVALKDLPTP